MCNGGLRGGKGSPYEGGVRAPAFFYWPACLGNGPRHSSNAPVHMVDLFATLVTAAQVDQRPGAQKALWARVRRHAPYSLSAWGALADGRAAAVDGSSAVTSARQLGDGGDGGGRHRRGRGRRRLVGTKQPGKAVESAMLSQAVESARHALHQRLSARHALHQRQLVLQMSASSGAVLRGRWKLVLGAMRCLEVPTGLPHDAKIKGFRADRWLLHRLGESNGSVVLGSARETRARLRAVRRAGVELQLFDVQADPGERTDLLAGLRLGHKVEVASVHANETLIRNETRAKMTLVGNLLAYYLGALHVGRRNLERAQAEGRVERGGTRGWEMIVWFCRQVEFAWTTARWRETAPMMCRGRSQRERDKLEAVPSMAQQLGGGKGTHGRLPQRQGKQQQQQYSSSI